MLTRKTIILASIISILAVFIPLSSAENSCLNCHEKLSAFSEKEKELNEVRVKHLARDVACSLECHASTIDKIAKSNYEQWTGSKHAMFNVKCNDCHGGNPDSDIKETAHTGVFRSSDSNSSVFYRNVPETCGKCHKDELKEFQNSAHYQKLKQLKQAPTCDTCHLPHGFKVLSVNDFGDLCIQCHNSDMRIAPSDAPEKAILTLKNAEKLKGEIKLAEDAIKQAGQKGQDIVKAKKELDTASSIRDHLPVLWHGFNLPNFESAIDEGMNTARQAQIDSGVSLSKPRTPGFGAILSITALLILSLFLRKK